MENLRIVKSVFILLGGMLLIVLAIPFFIFAYDDTTTHPALTDEIVDHFNRFYPEKSLSVSQKELVKQGSIDEDKDARWLRHFYDPIKNRGLVLGNDDLLRNPELAAIIGGSRSEWQSSKEWAQNTSAQAGLLGGSAYGSVFSFFSSNSDFSWDRAVYEYAWGDKNRAMLALGHILHLIEDASVPDHTRNDPHPHITEWFSSFNESPYEIWTKKFTPNNFSASINASPVILGGLNEYFDSMAGYSNGNFFSKDTILLSAYLTPLIAEKRSIVLKNGKQYTFGVWRDDFNGQYLLVKINYDFLSGKTDYSLDDPDSLILTDYWSHLSKQAILHGAGVTKLFFDEVAREQQTKTLYNKNRSWWQKMGDSIAGVWGNIFGNTTTSSAGLLATVLPIGTNEDARINTNTADETGIDVSPPLGVSPDEPDGGETSTTVGIEASPPSGGEASTTARDEASTTAGGDVSTAMKNPPLVFSAGGARPRRETGIEVSPPSGGETSTPTPDTMPPNPPIITAPTATLQTIALITFSGTAEARAIILNDFSTTTTAVEVSPPSGGETSTTTGAWTLAFVLPQGTSTINFFAKDAAGNTSTGIQKTIFVDSEAPDITLAIAECAASLSSAGCLVATTTVNLAWSSNAADLTTYTLSCAKDETNACVNFSYDSNATSTTFAAENNHLYTFTAKATDTAGNESPPKTKTVEIRTNPIVINEIAWAGTASSTEDEWIELKNNSAYAINFGGAWVLRAEDNTPSIILSESIPAGGYYLLERKDDLTVSDIAADQTYGNDGPSWALNNNGERLLLERVSQAATSTIDQAPALNACDRQPWCGGDVLGKKTSERIDPYLPGMNPANWATNNGIIKNGKDASGTALNGTPKARNSANYVIANLWSVQENRILTKAYSPYLIDNNGFTIPAGKMLTIGPGAVVKLVDTQSPLLIVQGTLKAEGTAEDPVIFTSIYDDAYGGDTNQDGICNPADASSTALCPNPGNWKQIYIAPTSAGTIINHTIIRYGGRWFNVPQALRAMLAVDDAEMQLINSTIERSWGHGLQMTNSDSVIENNIFRYNARTNSDTGFYLGGGNPIIRGNVSSYNSIGGLISNIGGVFSDNTFTNNIYEALLVSGSIPATTNTAASANGTNGIFLSSTPSGFSFLRGLPYIIEGQMILSSGVYTFEAGAILKFKNSSSGMTFAVPVAIAGSGTNPVVFTAYTDDAYGGDTNNDGVCAPEDASSTPACPAPGAWRGLQFTAGAGTSTLNNVIVRYGGSHRDWAGIKAESAALVIQNSVIEKNSYYGVLLLNSASSTITNTVIKNHTTPANDATVSGLYLAGSHANLGGIMFRANTIGINVPDFVTGGSTITITPPIDIDHTNIIKTIPPGLVL